MKKISLLLSTIYIMQSTQIHSADIGTILGTLGSVKLSTASILVGLLEPNGQMLQNGALDIIQQADTKILHTPTLNLISDIQTLLNGLHSHPNGDSSKLNVQDAINAILLANSLPTIS